VPYDPTIYLGSAAHYRYGHPAYSPELEAVLTQETGLDETGRLLDAGCGPGVLTIRLAHLFERAVGLDPDARMLAEGCRAAEEKGVTNIRWVQDLAEDLPAVAPGPYKLVTFGQSFHWTDEQQVAEVVYDMLEPGGALALIAHTVTGRPRPPDPGVPPIPHDDLKALVAKYLGSQRATEDHSRSGHRRQILLPLCLIDTQSGEVVEEGRLRTTPEAFGRRFASERPMRIAIEAGTHSPWVSRVLEECAHEVLVANSRKTRLIYSNKRKTDEVDAENLARLATVDPKLLYPLKHRNEDSQAHMALKSAHAKHW
jgi:SAM-dependent methyltransferase